MRHLLRTAAIVATLAPAAGAAQNVRVQSAGAVSGNAAACSPAPSVCEGVMAPGSVRWCDVDGTAKDMTTGNVWLKNLDCPEDLGIPQPFKYAIYSLWDSLRWAAALATHNCSLLDGSVAGDWSMPTRNQFLSLTQGVEPVSSATQRVFQGTVPTQDNGLTTGNYLYWTSEPWDGGLWYAMTLDAAPDRYAERFAVGPNNSLHHLPVRRTLTVTSVDALTPGRGFSLAPSSVLNGVEGASHFTRSYLSVPIYADPPLYVALAGWDNAFRTPRIFYFEADPETPGYFRIRHGHGSGAPAYLQVGGNSLHADAAVIGWVDPVWPTGDKANNRRWRPRFVCGKLLLESKLSGMCMYMANDGKFLRQEPCNPKSPGQLFVLTPRHDG